MRDRRVLAVLAAAYVVALAVLVGGPWGWALNRLTVRLYVLFRYEVPIAPDWALPEHYGVLLNVVLFVPVGAALVLVIRRPWWWATAVAAVASGAIEAVQGLFLAREASWLDVAANTTGALVGAVVSALLRRRAG
ncbi:VanZ family protein [Nocardioides oleivorans]|nr:VanZ family protein [Nocardioides oleivorans]